MSYYAGYSLREVYMKRCADLQCAANSAVVRLLSDVPDDFTSLTSLDLSRNFLGRKGIIPLLDVVECAKAIRSLDLRDQELGNESVAIICARLRRHPSLQRLNMSNNPITLAVATDLLELAKNNPVLQYISLERTLVRPSMVTVIELQLEKNRQRAARQDALVRPVVATIQTVAAATAMSTAGASSSSSPTTAGLGVASVVHGHSREHTLGADASPVTKTAESPTPAGAGASAAAALLRKGSQPPRSEAAARKRCPPHEIQHVLRTYTHTVSDILFDEDPTADLWDWCEEHHYFFDDDQFSSRNDDLHRTARHTYGFAGWRRIGELYPQASLFGTGAVSHFCAASGDESAPGAGERHATAVSAAAASGLLPEANTLFAQLPTAVPEGFTWTFTSVVASVKDVSSFQTLMCCQSPENTNPAARSSIAAGPMLALQKGTEFPGIYAMRLHVEGVWRYLIVDDFLPVDKFGSLVFSKPSLGDTAFWPCILEKMLAKLFGGYHALDLHLDERRVGIDSPSIRRHIAWNYLSRENLRRATSGSPVGCSSRNSDDEAPGSLFFERIAGGSGRLMSYLTSGFYESHRLHPLEERVRGEWWDAVLKALAGTRPSYLCAASRVASVGSAPPLGVAAAARVDGESRFRQASSVRHSMLGAAWQTSTATNYTNAAAAASPELHTGVVAFSRDAAHTTNGIHARTAYQVLQARHVNGVRLLMLRNPWCGSQRWSGDWADDSPLWKKNPEIAGLLLQRVSTFSCRGESIHGMTEAAAYAHGDSSVLPLQSTLKRSLLMAMRGSSGDGSSRTARVSSAGQSLASLQSGSSGVAHTTKSTFWISYTDFLQNFDWVHLCHVFGDDFYRRDIHHEWTYESAGGHVQEPSWHVNPHYRLMLPHRTTVRLQLNRCDVDLHRSRASAAMADTTVRGEGGIGLQVIRDAFYPLHCPPLGTRKTDAPFTVDGIMEDIAGSAAEPPPARATALLLGSSTSSASSFSTLLFSAVEQVGDHLTADVTLDAGTQYWIIPTTHAPRTLDHFDLTVVAPASFQVQEAAEAQYWDSRMTPQEVLVASSVPQISQSDGELAILFDAQSRVLMDAVAVLMQAESKIRMRAQQELNSEANAAPATVTPASAAAAPPQSPCRIVVTTTMEVADNDDGTGVFGVDEAYEQQMRRDDSFVQTPTLSLAVVRGDVDSEGNPSRTIGDINPHPAFVYTIGRDTVLETEVVTTAEHDVAYYTAICSPRPAGTRVLISYQVWCAAPLVEVCSLPKWAKQEITVCWDDQRGSGNFYNCDGHPQIELTELQPYQRFTVTVRMVDYDTIVPAIMFSVIRTALQTGEPISGRIANNELYARSKYVDVPEVQASFDLGDDIPASLLLIPCLQPTGSRGRCVVTISSDSAHFCARALCGGTKP